MNNPLISIIVPVYNGETYLARCLDSLLDQTYAPIEILVVNDGSQDRTTEILSQYEQYPQIKVFYQENKGVSQARNLALKNFNGDFVCFVDSDDYVTPTYCEKLYQALIKNNTDISICKYTFIEEEGKEVSFIESDNTYTYTSLEALSLLLEDTLIKSYPWGKLFNRKLFQNLSFPKDRIAFEDYALLFRLFEKAKAVVIINDSLYNYVHYENSLSHQMDEEKSFHFFLGIMEMYDFACQYREKLPNWNRIVEKTAKQSLFAIKRFYLFSKKTNKSIEQIMRERLTAFYSNEYKKIPFKYRWKIFSFLKLPFLYNTYIQFKKR
ncbi:glycosyltransferase family 2 protein [Capnocytophaga gingivalis]|uniref:glycosyltransferase family 2 protein n=1 Tax=Capnocytophaga gingivalis TaxID=1017 RepID=UPI0028E19965|nr:glycosyltransferase family 2 protein [Capnocytophaga gingivalis]